MPRAPAFAARRPPHLRQHILIQLHGGHEIFRHILVIGTLQQLAGLGNGGNKGWKVEGRGQVRGVGPGMQRRLRAPAPLRSKYLPCNRCSHSRFVWRWLAQLVTAAAALAPWRCASRPLVAPALPCA
jgi:hypothetical protein